MVSLGQYVAKCWVETFPPKSRNLENSKTSKTTTTTTSKIRLSKLNQENQREECCVEYLPRCEPFVSTSTNCDNLKRENSWDVWFCRNCCCPFYNSNKSDRKRTFRFMLPKRRQIFDANVRLKDVLLLRSSFPELLNFLKQYFLIRLIMKLLNNLNERYFFKTLKPRAYLFKTRG